MVVVVLDLLAVLPLPQPTVAAAKPNINARTSNFFITVSLGKGALERSGALHNIPPRANQPNTYFDFLVAVVVVVVVVLLLVDLLAVLPLLQPIALTPKPTIRARTSNFFISGSSSQRVRCVGVAVIRAPVRVKLACS